MKLKIYIAILLFLSSVGITSAQTQILSGTVTERFGDRIDPLIGVNVAVVNQDNRLLTGTVTDINGQYNIPIPSGEQNLTVVFSYIGMISQRVRYTGQDRLDIQLESDSQMIDEVVILGSVRDDMGISQNERVSATQRVVMDELIETVPVVSVEEALQGQLGGVDIIMGGGDPGTRSSIQIRGVGTLNAGSEPLIVIDGVPYSGDIADDFEFASADEEDLGALLNLAPSDIESVEVLKDASATAIWGTRGANGVLVITTKKGNVGKTRFSYSTKYTMKVEPKTIPMLNGDQYTALMQDAIWNSANYVGVANAGTYLRYLFDTPEIGYSPNWRYFHEYNQNTNWLDEVRKDATKLENNFSMTGGGEKATYRLSFGHVRDDGTTIGTSLGRFNTSMTVTYAFSNRLKFGADFAYTQSDQDLNWATNVRSEAFGKMPNKSPYVIDRVTGQPMDDYFVYQSLGWEGAFSSNESGSNAKNYNPVAMAREARRNTLERNSKYTFRVAEFRILPELTYRAYASIGLKTTKQDKFLPQIVTAVAWTNQYANQSYESYSESISLQTENRMTYMNNWNEKHNLIGNLLFRTSQSTSSRYVSMSSGMASSDMSDPTVSANVRSIGSGESEGRSLGLTALINYTLLDRYVVHGSLSVESNSALGRNRRMGYFPGVGVAWNIHNEPILGDVRSDWMDQFRFRLGIGRSGRPPSGNAIYTGAFGATDNFMGMSSIEPKRIHLDNLKWEESTEYNIGTDMSFFKGRLRFTADYYEKYSSDLLQRNFGVPSSTGFAQIAYYNSGKMTNKGWEARTDVRIFQNRDWTISGNVNFARNRNRITEMPINMRAEVDVAEGDADLSNGDYARRVIEGHPLGSFYGFRYLGVYSDKEATYARDAEGNIMNDMEGNPIIMRNGIYRVAPGDAKYEDINNDGVINKYDMVYLGNSLPMVTGGGGVSIRYKRVSLNTFFHYRLGQSVVNTARMNNESMYGKRNQSTAVLRRWRTEGDVTDIPRALYDEGLNYLGSDRFVENASYLRLKTLSFSYNFPGESLRKYGINSLNLFVTGYNLFTWTNYKGQDPEVRMPGGSQLATDGATTPVPRQFTCGLNLSF